MIQTYRGVPAMDREYFQKCLAQANHFGVWVQVSPYLQTLVELTKEQATQLGEYGLADGKTPIYGKLCDSRGGGVLELSMNSQWLDRLEQPYPTDGQRLDWLEGQMRLADGYVEIYLAGLRLGHAPASAFQVELQDRPAVNGPSLRAAIDAAQAANLPAGAAVAIDALLVGPAAEAAASLLNDFTAAKVRAAAAMEPMRQALLENRAPPAGP